MLAWAVVSASTAFVTTPFMFYALRFLLGVAEAGFFPGIVLYLTHWYPAQRRGAVMALLLPAVPLTGVIGSPLSGSILQSMDGWHGLAGWQWLYLVEAAPSVVAGIVTPLLLDRGIDSAKWLTADEKALLLRNVETEAQGKHNHTPREVFHSALLWRMSAIYFSLVMGLYGISFWMPTIIRATGVSQPLDIGLLTTIPYLAGVLCMIPLSRRSDRLLERRWHVAIPGFGLLMSTTGYPRHDPLAGRPVATEGYPLRVGTPNPPQASPSRC